MSEQLPSFVKALRQFFNIPSNTAVAEYNALTEQDKVELSGMLQKYIPHTPYTPKS